MEEIIAFFDSPLFIGIATSLVVLGISYFSKKNLDKNLKEYQAEIDKQMKKIESCITRSDFIHSVRFRREFEILVDLWKCAARFETAFSKIVKLKDKTEKEFDGLVASFVKSRKYLKTTMRENEPFFDESVFIYLSMALTTTENYTKRTNISDTISDKEFTDLSKFEKELIHAKSRIQDRLKEIENEDVTSLGSLCV